MSVGVHRQARIAVPQLALDDCDARPGMRITLGTIIGIVGGLGGFTGVGGFGAAGGLGGDGGRGATGARGMVVFGMVILSP
jgi:hypothetical protein